jgi:hypothetical protein
MISVVAVPPWDVETTVQNFRSIFEKACSRTRHTSLAELASEATRREAVLWLVLDDTNPIAGGFTHVATRNDGTKVIEITAMGGTQAKRWIGAMRKRLHAFRKAEGADLITAYGRKGWGRLVGEQPVGLRDDGCWIYEASE